MTMFHLLFFIVFLQVGSSQTPSPLVAWELSANDVHHRLPDSSVVLPEEQTITLNFEALFQFFSPLRHQRNSNNNTNEVLDFPLPGFGMQTCTLSPSQLFHPELASKLASLVVIRQGHCSPLNVPMFMNMNLDDETSFSATFALPNRFQDWLYVDMKPPTMSMTRSRRTEYVIYPKSSRKQPSTTKSFHCNGEEVDNRAVSSPSSSSLLLEGENVHTPVVFRLALMANREYAITTGDTLASTMNAMAIVMSRVNAIYSRELGVYFQFIPQSDALVCVASATQDCATLLPNYSGSTILNNAATFLSKRGVLASSYDLGHVFTTGSGGLATVAVLCNNRKARGTTGSVSPFGDAFSVDYVAHEIGHQLNGFHSFRHCNWDGNEMLSGAVEPGSGSTIMSYAGICGGNRNLQPHSDAYFHPSNLVQMNTFIQNQVQSKSCGVPNKMLAFPRPSVSLSLQFQCEIPIGNYFALVGNATLASFFQWEETALQLQRYSDLSIPRFRSWKPRFLRTERFFPNLHSLVHEVDQTEPFVFWENLPQTDTTMTFRFTARTSFDSKTSELGHGHFHFQDVPVHFVRTTLPLKFTPTTRNVLKSTTTLRGGDSFSFAWTGGGGGSDGEVEVLFAINTMSVFVTAKDFDSEVNLKDLEWIVLGRALTSAKVLTVSFPPQLNTIEVNFMIRTAAASDSYCFPFDFISRVQLLPGGSFETTLAPTPPPSLCQAMGRVSKRFCLGAIKACKKRGVAMKWSGAGCVKDKVRFPDAGCQCKEYCGYGCERRCKSDRLCRWNSTDQVCVHKQSGLPGVPIPYCY